MLRPKRQLNLPGKEEPEVRASLGTWDDIVIYWQQNRQRILSIGGAAVVIVVAVIWWVAHSREQAEVASLDLSRIRSYFDAGQYRKAIEGDSAKTVRNQPVLGLKEIVEEYGSTKAGKLAALYLGNSYYYLGEFDKARKAYEDATGVDDPTLSAAAYAGLAAILESDAKYEDAGKAFEKAASVFAENVNNGFYKVAAARNLARINQGEAAIRLYREVLADFPGTTADDLARRGLAELNVDL